MKQILIKLNVIGGKRGSFTTEDGNEMEYFQIKCVDELDNEHVYKCDKSTYENLCNIKNGDCIECFLPEKTKIISEPKGNDGFDII